MQTALITGANKGIGYEIAYQLGKQGFHVWVAARNDLRGQKATDQLNKDGIQANFVLMDVGNKASIETAYAQVSSQIPQLDVLINNAAVLLDDQKDLLATSDQAIEDSLRINSLGVLYVSRIFAPLLKKGSRIVNVSSSAGTVCGGMKTYAPIYSISKATENAITMQLAHAFASKGITVNAVCPGWVRTDMGGSAASRSIAKGAETPVWLATDPQLKETGKFYRDKALISW